MQFRSIKRGLVQIASITLLVIVAFVGFCVLAERKGEKAAKEFCSTLAAEGPTNKLLELATQSGAETRYLKWRQGQNEFENDTLLVIYSGAFPLSRHACRIQAKHQKIVAFEYAYYD